MIGDRADVGNGDEEYHRKKNESYVTQVNTVYPAKAKFILARIGPFSN